ncbi:exodeoxyribonuclease V subunit gamma [Comamonadaceae bacterium OH3737_COT-264]|nr:exodeoxyribonuclease V subunit gamma [Comamonadaceae bacterium OH3737_COT-264]
MSAPRHPPHGASSAAPDGAPPPFIAPGIVAVHSNRTEDLARMLAEWMRSHPLGVLEQDVILVQSNGMAEWLKMALARELGISAALQVELPGRFAWRMYRQILGARQVPYQTPLDKPDMLWRLMRLLPSLLAGSDEVAHEAGDAGAASVWQPLRQTLEMAGASAAVQGDAGAATLALYQLALRIADLLDQYQVYRPDWLYDWARGRDVLARMAGEGSAQPEDSQSLPPEARWQATIWRALLQSLAQHAPEGLRSRLGETPLAQAIRPRLHQRAMAALRQGQVAAPLPRRVVLFGVSHAPLPILELLLTMAQRSQVLLAVPNPCKEYWSDALDGRELFARMQRQARAAPGRVDLASVPLHAMHAHANPLLTMWGRQVRDFVRLLEHYENQDAGPGAQPPAHLHRIDLYEEDEAAPAPGQASASVPMLRQVQQHIRDLTPLPAETAGLADPTTHEDSGGNAIAADLALAPGDRSICFQVAHSPVRELQALHDHLLDVMRRAAPSSAGQGGTSPVAPREVVVMVPDIGEYAPLIRAVFGQYDSRDSRYIPFDIADLEAEDASTLVQAVQWLARLPEQRAGLSELSDLLAVPAVARRLGLDADGVAQLQDWMQGSGMRWGIDAAHRARLGVAHMGEQNTAWFGLQRMLLAYASSQPWHGVQPYAEVGGLAAQTVGALAWLVDRLQYWSEQLATPASAGQWVQRWRALMADFLESGSDEADQAALAMLEKALQQWLDATLRSAIAPHEAQPLPLAVARHAWLSQLGVSGVQRRFHAGGVTFCTLLPMRAIPFRIVCLLGMNEGVYPRPATPNEMDLMRLPGLLRPGDRSRAQDDRQLMLEALLSAREQFLVSWVGRSVRDNTECPPSVLVAQLRDYLSAWWGEAAVQARTVEHPLQAFNPRYFLMPEQAKASDAATAALHTWASEWQPVALAVAEAGASPNPPAMPAPAGGAAQASAHTAADPLVWNVRELAELWRNPAQKWFATRLQTRFAALPELLSDCEPLRVDGLERWKLFDRLLQQLHPLVETPGASLDALQQHVQHYLNALQRQGELPVGLVAEQLQAQWMQDWQFLLQQWLQAVQDRPQRCASRQLLQWPPAQEQSQAQARVQDWAPPLRLPAGMDAATDAPNLQQHGQYLDVLPDALQDLHRDAPYPLKLKKLIAPWLQALLLSACAESAADGPVDAPAAVAPTRILALDAVLEITPLPSGLARQWLAAIVALADTALLQPLPFDFATAQTWLKAVTSARAASADKALAKAREIYEADPQTSFASNPYATRLWPDFDALHGTGQFEQLAQEMLGPLLHWVERYVCVSATKP